MVDVTQYVLEEQFGEDQRRVAARLATGLLGSLVQKGQYVGDVYSLGYETALVLIHDFYRKQVGGIPSLSFLVATRIDPEAELEYTNEDSSVLLLRVMDAAQLPNAAEAERVRVETAQRVSGEAAHWDDPQAMDPSTANLLSFAGVKCRVLGTFYVDQRLGGSTNNLVLKFGGDLSNYYPNRGLKVYKPNSKALEQIVNYRDPDRSDLRSPVAAVIGTVRYASTHRSFQGVADVKVNLQPADLLRQKTALFGMTRTGKSNTTKVILKSVYALRNNAKSVLRIGQIVFDPNGEYANENVQDAAGQDRNPAAVKNVGERPANDPSGDVFTYGITEHPNDPGRRRMLLNFYEEGNLDVGKEIIDGYLSGDATKYISNFRQVRFAKPNSKDWSALTRYTRRVLVYRALLNRAGFEAPSSIQPNIQGLFNKEFINLLDPDEGTPWPGAPGGRSVSAERTAAARLLQRGPLTWAKLAAAFETIAEVLNKKDASFQAFNTWYTNDRQDASGEPWADPDLQKLFEMFRYPNGWRQLGQARPHHTHTTTKDYTVEIYEHLSKGHLVIVDQSGGDTEINKTSADRIVQHIYLENQKLFRNGQQPPDILVYAEEAHNLLPAGSETDLADVWVRTAKEGAKYEIGMVYATQEVSSIQRNILKNTANWFIGHLNNTDETRELTKYYDFADFEGSIRRAADPGFIRVKTLSNLFVVPVQVKRFEV